MVICGSTLEVPRSKKLNNSLQVIGAVGKQALNTCVSLGPSNQVSRAAHLEDDV